MAHPPVYSQGRKPGAALGWRLKLAWAAVFWERTWPRLWAPFSVAGLWLALALTGVLPSLSGWTHTAVLAGFGIAFILALLWGFRGYKLPQRQDALRRLEAKNALQHRPLDAVEDTLGLGSGDPMAEAMWRAHQDRERARIRALKVGLPEVETARFDKYALRGAVMLLLLLGIMVGWGDPGTRLANALSPTFGQKETVKLAVEGWLTPPDYTGKAPRMLTAAQLRKPLVAPKGSRLMIQIHGVTKTPLLVTGRQQVAFERLDQLSHQGTLEIHHAGALKITADGNLILKTSVKLSPDKVPTVAWVKAPTRTNRSSLRLQYKAEDDYRIAFMRAFVARDGERRLIKLDLPITGGKKAKGTSFHDLTAHPWAGLTVSIIIEAEDDAGQRGRSKIKNVQLPRRYFRHPVAREIIKQRRLLYLLPEDMPQITARIGRLAEMPERYGHDHQAYLALRIAQARLFRALKDDGRSDAQLIAGKNAAVRAAVPLLWEAALRIEEGSLSRAEREVRRLQRLLSQKLSEKNADPKELKRLMNQLEKAMRDYMQALREDMKKNPQKYAQRPSDQSMQNMSPRDMNKMMQEMRRMLQNNERQNLQKRLSELRQMMEDLRRGQARPMNPNHPALKAMRELGDIIRKQQKLNDQTFRRSQQQRDGQKTDKKEAQRQQQEQQKLQQRLGELMKKLNKMTGKTPKNLGNAQKDMQRAEGQLKKNRPGQAIGPQKRALERLRKGAGQAMRQLARRFGLGQRMGRGLAGRNGSPRQGRNQDPLGRRMEGMGRLNTDDVKVPTESEKKRARDILNELRRRSGEAERPKLERDYIDRLLRQF